MVDQLPVSEDILQIMNILSRSCKLLAQSFLLQLIIGLSDNDRNISDVVDDKEYASQDEIDNQNHFKSIVDIKMIIEFHSIMIRIDQKVDIVR